MVETARWETHTYQVLADVENLMSVLKDAEVQQRNYLLTGMNSTSRLSTPSLKPLIKKLPIYDS